MQKIFKVARRQLLQIWFFFKKCNQIASSKETHVGKIEILKNSPQQINNNFDTN